MRFRSKRTRSLRTLTFSIVFIATCVASCSDRNAIDPIAPTGVPEVSSSVATSAQDSAAGEEDAIISSLLNTSIRLQEGDGFVVELISRECTAPADIISITSPVDEVLTMDGCHEPDVGTTWTFEGPYPAGTTVNFRLFAANVNRPGSVRITGSYPTWTVGCEDAAQGGDFDDIVFSVNILKLDSPECQLFPSPINDRLLGNPAVQRILKNLAELSNFNEPLQDRLERGGYIVKRQDGTIEFVEHRYIDPTTMQPTDPQLCITPYDPQFQAEIRAGGDSILAQVHTHPVENDVVPNPGNCVQYFVRPNGTWGKKLYTMPFLNFDPGPSPRDLDLFRQGVVPWPGLVLSPEKVYRYEREGIFETGLKGGEPHEFELNSGEDACIP